MTWQRPIFERGIPGANRAVVNTWMRGATSALDNADVMSWGRAQMAAGNVVTLGLCKVKSAAVITPNRWQYTVEHWFPPSLAGGGITPPGNLTFSYTNVQNLSEYFNTSIMVDGMPTNSPSVIVGPVGSQWDGSAFPTGTAEMPLMAVVNVWVVYALDGTAWPYFDRPNPVVCAEVDENQE
jgi:hypothetical protein